ncbi:MAG TPA: hypothetical protein VIQ27_10210 [Gemmatimonadales bacterium]|jgi:hypothetical protein
MIRGPTVALCLLLALSGCRGYDYESPISRPDGFIPGDQMARYGREQAQAVAVARAFAAARTGNSPAALTAQADSAVRYARTLPDVANAVADPLSHRLTLQFRSGWIDGVVPLDDGTPAPRTPNLPTAPAP